MNEVDKAERHIHVGPVHLGLKTCDECGATLTEEVARTMLAEVLAERRCLICQKSMLFSDMMLWHWCATDKRPERNPRWHVYIEDEGDLSFRVKVEHRTSKFCLEGSVHVECVQRAIPGMHRFDFGKCRAVDGFLG